VAVERLQGRNHIFVLVLCTDSTNAIPKTGRLRVRRDIDEIPKESGQWRTIWKVTDLSHHPIAKQRQLPGQLRRKLSWDFRESQQIGESTRVKLL
jgi:hypothetical protein